MPGISYATRHSGANTGADGSAPEPGELALKLRWVRGIESNLNDLVVRGERFTTHFGDAVLTGTLRRKIVGASEIKITVSDPFRRLLNKPIVAERHELELDGLQWVLVKISGEGMGAPMTLTYEPRVVAELKKIMGPLRGRREQMTRAEFGKKLTELLPRGRRPRFISPLLHKVQPIKTQAEAKKAESTATSERKKGLNRAGLTVKGETPSAEQYELGEMALAIAESHGAPSAVMTMVIMALIDETDLGAVQRGNVLAALEPYTQVRDAAEEIAAFVSGEPTWTGTSAMKEYAASPNEKLSVLVQRVQKSGTPDGSNYAAFEAEAKKWTEAWGGGVDASATSEQITKKYEFAVGKKESAWKALVRLAGEVNWRCFESAGWIYFIDEIELLKQKTLMRITPYATGFLDLKYDHDEGKETDELQVTAWAKAWEAPPGTMVEVVGWGPNDGTYLVSTIEAPLATRESEVQITLKRPHKPLKEPAPERVTRSLAAGGAGVGAGGYASPVSASEWDASRVDMGVDFINHSAASKVFAIGNAKILKIGAPGWPGEGGVLYELLDGARKGQIIYCYENVLPHVSAGATVQAGEVIATMKGTGYPWIEIGFADASGQALGTPEHSEGADAATKPGEEMRAFLTQLGAP